MPKTVTAEAPVENQAGDKPVFRLSDRGVQLSTFENTVETPNGTRTYYNTTVQCRYKDKQGHWQTSNRFDEEQLAVLSDLAADARRAMRQARALAKAERA